MPVFTVRVDEELKKKMDDLKEVNWSGVTRAAIEEKVREMEMWRRVDVLRLKLASAETDDLRRKVEGWSSTSEIRRWRSRVRDSS
jgi:predicted transcriptional regulator